MIPRALIVEDDRSWQQILTELLSDAGLTVDVADSFEAAQTALRAAPHRIAVIDLSLAGSNHRNQDGLRVLEAVRRHDPGCTPLLLTGFATVEIAVSAMKDFGAHTCLRKERFRRAEFRDLLRDLLAAAPEPGQSDVGAGAAVEKVGKVGGRRKVEGDRGVVLVAEDDAGWRSILAEIITDAGYETLVCGSYGEALGHLRRGAPALAVIDLSLASSLSPDQNADGYRLLDAARQHGIPAIVVSGAAAPADAERVFAEFDAFAFVEKQGFDRRAFREVLAGALASAAAADHLAALTAREREVLDLLVRGMTNKQMAEQLVISPNTVKRHLKAIFAKLEVNTRAAAVARAMGDQ